MSTSESGRTVDRIYLDNNATTPVLSDVAEAMYECLSSGYSNPASAHRSGRVARRRLEEARRDIAAALGARIDDLDGDRLIFTSGATEANNLALRGLIDPHSTAAVLVSSLEHPSISDTATELARLGIQVKRIRAQADGTIDLNHLAELLQEPTQLLSLMLGNNETGVLQPVAVAAEMCRAAGVRIHTDAVQAVGKSEVDLGRLQVDALSFTAHKFHGPRGIGGLLLKAGVPLQPLMTGGFQQQGLRPGTESIALAVGLQTAVNAWRLDLPRRCQHLRALRDRFEQQLTATIHLAGDADVVVCGSSSERLPHTSNVAFPGLDRQSLLMSLDLAGVECATGSACASGSSEPSPVLLAMGLDESLVESSLRFSFGVLNTLTEIDRAIERISNAVNSLRI